MKLSNKFLNSLFLIIVFCCAAPNQAHGGFYDLTDERKKVLDVKYPKIYKRLFALAEEKIIPLGQVSSIKKSLLEEYLKKIKSDVFVGIENEFFSWWSYIHLIVYRLKFPKKNLEDDVYKYPFSFIAKLVETFIEEKSLLLSLGSGITPSGKREFYGQKLSWGRENYKNLRVRFPYFAYFLRGLFDYCCQNKKFGKSKNNYKEKFESFIETLGEFRLKQTRLVSSQEVLEQRFNAPSAGGAIQNFFFGQEGMENPDLLSSVSSELKEKVIVQKYREIIEHLFKEVKPQKESFCMSDNTPFDYYLRGFKVLSFWRGYIFNMIYMLKFPEACCGDGERYPFLLSKVIIKAFKEGNGFCVEKTKTHPSGKVTFSGVIAPLARDSHKSIIQGLPRYAQFLNVFYSYCRKHNKLKKKYSRREVNYKKNCEGLLTEIERLTGVEAVCNVKKLRQEKVSLADEAESNEVFKVLMEEEKAQSQKKKKKKVKKKKKMKKKSRRGGGPGFKAKKEKRRPAKFSAALRTEAREKEIQVKAQKRDIARILKEFRKRLLRNQADKKKLKKFEDLAKYRRQNFEGAMLLPQIFDDVVDFRNQVKETLRGDKYKKVLERIEFLGVERQEECEKLLIDQIRQDVMNFRNDVERITRKRQYRNRGKDGERRRQAFYSDEKKKRALKEMKKRVSEQRGAAIKAQKDEVKAQNQQEEDLLNQFHDQRRDRGCVVQDLIQSRNDEFVLRYEQERLIRDARVRRIETEIKVREDFEKECSECEKLLYAQGAKRKKQVKKIALENKRISEHEDRRKEEAISRRGEWDYLYEEDYLPGEEDLYDNHANLKLEYGENEQKLREKLKQMSQEISRREKEHLYGGFGMKELIRDFKKLSIDENQDDEDDLMEKPSGEKELYDDYANLKLEYGQKENEQKLKKEKLEQMSQGMSRLEKEHLYDGFGLKELIRDFERLSIDEKQDDEDVMEIDDEDDLFEQTSNNWGDLDIK